jgi:branched-chain amino acid transport system ATP-binding protein
MLSVKNLHAGYGNIEILHDVSIEVYKKEIVCLLGANGAGKTTLLKAISGLIKCSKGSITFLDKRIENMQPEKIVSNGIACIPEGRMVFPDSTVLVNLEMGAYCRSDSKEIKKDLEKYFEAFPILHHRRNMPASLLSGGEQQMLVIARALMSRPKLLLLDEPSMGLSPLLVNQIFQIIIEVHQIGVPVFLVEQNIKKALRISKRGYVLENGIISIEGLSEELHKSDKIRKVYLGEEILS